MRAITEHIDDQEKQIAALKATCHKYCQKSIWLDHQDRSLESAGAAAKKQLARDLPGIDWGI
jgi:hypothetical protein